MNVAFDVSVSLRQTQWVEEALSLCRYPSFGSIPLNLMFTVVDEPPCDGHQDYMCTQTDGEGGGTIYIRAGADDADATFNAGLRAGGFAELKRFFIESVNHELGHVVSFTLLTTDELKSEAAALFTFSGDKGEGYRTGTLDDWNPLDKPHDERIQEAVAEVFKDTYLDESQRVYENRSKWNIGEGEWATLIGLLQVPQFPLDPQIIGTILSSPPDVGDTATVDIEVVNATYTYQNPLTGEVLSVVDVTGDVEIALPSTGPESWVIDGHFPPIDSFPSEQAVFLWLVVHISGFPGGLVHIGGGAVDARGTPFGGGQSQEAEQHYFIGTPLTTGVSYTINGPPGLPRYPYEPETIDGAARDAAAMRFRAQSLRRAAARG